MQNVFGGTPYGTLGLLLVAYVAEALPFSARLAGGALAQVGDHLLEAGRMAGATTAQLFRHIVLPVVATALLSTWMLNFTGTLFELPASELLQPAGEPPLSVQIINQYSHYRQGPGTAMTIVAIALVALAALLIAGATRALRARGGRAHARRSF
jgi:iron(III) transport system permease protein